MSNDAQQPPSGLSYEEARGRLQEIVTQLGQGRLPLEESLKLWEEGEKLGAQCEKILADARQRIAQVQAARTAENG